MKIMLNGKTEHPDVFGGSFPMEAELPADLVEEIPGMRKALQLLAQRLSAQLSKETDREVIGVDFHRVSFSLMYGPKVPVKKQ